MVDIQEGTQIGWDGKRYLIASLPTQPSTQPNLIRGIEVVANASKRSDVAESLNSDDSGYFVYQDDTDTLYVWTGSSFDSIGGSSVNLLDEDDFASDSDTDGATQQSIGAYVDTQLTQVPGIITESTTSRTLSLSDAGQHIRTTNGSATTVTVPPNSSVAFPIGTYVTFLQAGAGTLTLAEGSGVTLNKPSDKTLAMRAQYSGAQIVKVDTDTWDLIGDIGDA